MAIIDQPKPSQPKSPVPETQPLSPGTADSRRDSSPSTRVNQDLPERSRDERDDAEPRR